MTVSQSNLEFPNTAGVILCGGKSSRMGLPKWSLPVGEENCLQRTIRIARQVVSPIIVVAAEGQQITGLPADVKLIRDEIPEKGPLAGLSAALEHLKAEPEITSAYVTACDVPLLKAEFIAAIISQLADHDLAVVKEGKFHHPLAAVYRVELADRVKRLLEVERLRPLFLIEESRSHEIDVEQLRQVDPELDSLRNMNKPEDYREILQTLNLSPPD